MSFKSKILTFVVVNLFISQPSSAAIYTDWSDYEQEVFALVNLQRSINSLDLLTADSRLNDAAVAHSTDMSVNGFFSHTGSNGSSVADRIRAAGYAWTAAGENIAAGSGMTFIGGQPTMRAAEDAARLVMYGSADLNELNAFSIDNGLAAFNSWTEVGTNWNDSTWNAWHSFKSNFGGWMGSSGHRHNILSNLFTDLGVGFIFSASQGAPYYAYWTQDFAAGDTAPVPLPSAIWLFAGGLAILRLGTKKTTLV